MIHVLLADDHPVVRSGYQRLLALEPDIRVVAEAADADAAYAGFIQHQPDVLVTDLTMPGGGGLDLIRRVLRRAPQARVLVFSMHDSVPLVRQALDSGARGFLTKASAPESLVHAVRTLAAGDRYLAPELPAWLLDASRRGDAGEGLSALSVREFEIFRLLAQGASATECAQALKLSPKTVANHQTVIKEKLGVSTSAALAHLALRHGVIGGPVGV
ncbi:MULTISPECIES: response regulator transcription factor [Aquincola]|uniref:response regulator n=1 Tax=Aquincola TaxID=391952 RepID=UPI00061524E6|nr:MULTISPECIES: response regulator transcription factor [Aquincola]MCR5868857.1 response regulator transcription factor [Aquincola sp. J276]